MGGYSVVFDRFQGKDMDGIDGPRDPTSTGGINQAPPVAK